MPGTRDEPRYTWLAMVVVLAVIAMGAWWHAHRQWRALQKP